MRGSILRRLARLTSTSIHRAIDPRLEPTSPAGVAWIANEVNRRQGANRAARRARADEELVPPELARRPPLTDGDPGV